HLAAVRLGQPQALFDRVLVKLVDDSVGGVPVQRGVRGLERALGVRVGHLLNADDDVHDRRPTSLFTSQARPTVLLFPLASGRPLGTTFPRRKPRSSVQAAPAPSGSLTAPPKTMATR